MNNPKPQEWKSEELSKGRIIDYKPLTLWMAKASAIPSMSVAVCFTVKAAIMQQLGLSTQAFPTPKSWKSRSWPICPTLCSGLDLAWGGTLSQHWHPAALGQAGEKRTP